MMGRLAMLLALAAGGMGSAALAQETPFSPQATEACLAAATEEAAKAACLGLSANACMAAQPGGPSTAGDDFAFFAGEAPGCYVWLGNGPAVDGALHHNTSYDFNDAAIVPGVAFWATLVEQELAAE